MFMVRKGYSKILRLRNPLEVFVDFNLAIYDLSLHELFLLVLNQEKYEKLTECFKPYQKHSVKV